jgi:hypothetical protein
MLLVFNVTFNYFQQCVDSQNTGFSHDHSSKFYIGKSQHRGLENGFEHIYVDARPMMSIYFIMR